MKMREAYFALVIAVALSPALNAADYTIKAGSTGRSIYVQMTDVPTSAKYVRAQGTLNSFLSTELADIDSAWSSGKWKAVDANGWGALVRFDLPDAALAAGVPSVSILVADANEHRHVTIDLVGYDPTAAALPANVVQVDGVNNGTHASGYLGADVRNYGGTAGTFSSGRPEVNLTHAGGNAIGTTGTANFRRFFDGNGYGPLLFAGAIDDVTTQTRFIILTPVGGIEDDSLNGLTIVLRDGPDFSLRTIVSSDRVGSSSSDTVDITIDSAPTFTATTSTTYEILPASFNPPDRTAATAAQTKIGFLPSVTAGSNGGLPTVDANNAVRVQSGSGTGQLDFTSGVVKANLTQVVGDTTAGGNAKKFFDGTGWGPLLFAGAMDTVTSQTNFIILTPQGGIEDGSLDGLTIVLRQGGDFSLRTITSSDRLGSGSSDTVEITIDAAPTFTATTSTTYEILPPAFNEKALAEVSGTASSGSTTTLVSSSLTQADTDYWKGSWLLVTSGSTAGQIRQISGFNPSTDTITVDRAFTQAISTNKFMILRTGGGETNVTRWQGTAVAAPNVDGVPKVDITHVLGTEVCH